ncbi:hypothetical protein DITRI_Ditri04bG0027100 [Diplodiscus trichospermus]
MELEIISRETIKPWSSTPLQLRTHKLSLLDQFHLSHRLFVPIILFYSSSINGESPRSRSFLLKDSLSKTLTHFYPFAGRVKDSFSIDCNDQGVIYIEAQVASDMSIVLEEPSIDLLQQLIPCNECEKLSESSADGDQVMLAIQVNYFACGSMAICASVSHVVADASAAASFVKSWAAVACGADPIDGVVYDCASLFPPQDFSEYWKVVNKNQNLLLPQGNLVTKRFLFDGHNIAALRNEIGNIASRFEALSALIWSAMIATTTENNEQRFATASVSVDLRKRMNPPLPQQCIGNVVHMTISESAVTKKKMNLTSLAEKIHDSIKKLDDEHVRELHAGDGYINLARNAVEGFKNNLMFGFTSWCRFPFYETDFGWGKPVWFGTTVRFNRAAFFMDTRDGEGIEAWITLSQEEMAKLEQDPGILAYASFKPSA